MLLDRPDPDQVSRMLVNASTAARKRCKFHRAVRRVAEPVFDSIRSGVFQPSRTFTFSVYESQDVAAGTYVEMPLGLFASREDCEALDTRARTLTIPTAACRTWGAAKGESPGMGWLLEKRLLEFMAGYGRAG
jgi:hypothetical protein